MAIGSGSGPVPWDLRRGALATAGLLHVKKTRGRFSLASFPRRKKTQARFVELMGGTRERVDEYLIEFESARGRKLRIHCKSNNPPDWPSLLGAWCRAET